MRPLPISRHRVRLTARVVGERGTGNEESDGDWWWPTRRRRDGPRCWSLRREGGGATSISSQAHGTDHTTTSSGSAPIVPEQQGRYPRSNTPVGPPSRTSPRVECFSRRLGTCLLVPCDPSSSSKKTRIRLISKYSRFSPYRLPRSAVARLATALRTIINIQRACICSDLPWHIS